MNIIIPSSSFPQRHSSPAKEICQNPFLWKITTAQLLRYTFASAHHAISLMIGFFLTGGLEMSTIHEGSNLRAWGMRCQGSRDTRLGRVSLRVVLRFVLYRLSIKTHSHGITILLTDRFLIMKRTSQIARKNSRPAKIFTNKKRSAPIDESDSEPKSKKSKKSKTQVHGMERPKMKKDSDGNEYWEVQNSQSPTCSVTALT